MYICHSRNTFKGWQQIVYHDKKEHLCTGDVFAIGGIKWIFPRRQLWSLRFRFCQLYILRSFIGYCDSSCVTYIASSGRSIACFELVQERELTNTVLCMSTGFVQVWSRIRCLCVFAVMKKAAVHIHVGLMFTGLNLLSRKYVKIKLSGSNLPNIVSKYWGSG